MRVLAFICLGLVCVVCALDLARRLSHTRIHIYRSCCCVLSVEIKILRGEVLERQLRIVHEPEPQEPLDLGLQVHHNRVLGRHLHLSRDCFLQSTGDPGGEQRRVETGSVTKLVQQVGKVVPRVLPGYEDVDGGPAPIVEDLLDLGWSEALFKSPDDDVVRE